MTRGPDDIVFTGFGVCCNLGDQLDQVMEQLRIGAGKPFEAYPPAVEYGSRCQIIGHYRGEVSDEALGIVKAQGRFMGRTARIALKAARAAIAQSGADVRDAAVIVGSGAGDVATHIEISERLAKSGNMRRISPMSVPKIMTSTVSANLATVLRARGPSCTLTAACAGGAYNIIMAALLVRSDLVTRAVAGGAEAHDPHFFAGFDAMAAYNRDDNDQPQRASRPYAADRKGFIFGEGAGVVVLEKRATAEARDAQILGVLRGFGMASDGTGQMVQPSSEGGLRAMQQALSQAQIEPGQVEYVNTHGTSTPLGDLGEIESIRELLDGRHVAYSSTKGYTGHTVSGAGAIEAIFTAEMIRRSFLVPCLNATPLDPALLDYPPLLEPRQVSIDVAMSNSFGFGGTNVSLVLGRGDGAGDK